MPVVWIVLVVLAIALVLRRRYPTPFPAFLAPMLESRLRLWFVSPAAVVERLELQTGMRVLEIGPGSGLFTDAIARSGTAVRLVCLDVQPAMLHRVRERLGVGGPELVCASASVLPFDAACFDRILLVSVLGEVPDRDAALRECARVLGNGGVLVISESMLDPDFLTPATLIREAAGADLVPLDRSGSWASYTQRFSHRRIPA